MKDITKAFVVYTQNFVSENLDKPNNPKKETFPIIKKYPTSGPWPAQSMRRKGGHKLLLSSTKPGSSLHKNHPTSLPRAKPVLLTKCWPIAD